MDTIINVQLFQQLPRLVVVRLANRSKEATANAQSLQKNLETIRHGGPAVALRLASDNSLAGK